MTVEELLEKLREVPADSRVAVSWDSGFGHSNDVELVVSEGLVCLCGGD